MAQQNIRIHTNLPEYWVENEATKLPLSNRSPSPSSLPPDYVSAINQHANDRNSSSSDDDDDDDDDDESDASLPSYEATAISETGQVTKTTTPAFCPTVTLRIENKGHPWLALPTPPKPIPIPVYAAETSSDGGGVGEEVAVFTSMRDEQNPSSGNCVLVRNDTSQPVSVTTYRFGPGKPPLIRLIPNSSSIRITSPAEVHELLSAQASSATASHSIAEPKEPEPEPIEVTPQGFTTRVHTLSTRLGTFRWRYGTRSEQRKVQAEGSGGLLIMERITNVAAGGGRSRNGEEEEEQVTKVAHLLRLDEKQRQAGSGGSLMLDLRPWADSKSEAAEEMKVLALTSCLVMMKMEIDRRRIQQSMLIVGVVG